MCMMSYCVGKRNLHSSSHSSSVPELRVCMIRSTAVGNSNGIRLNLVNKGIATSNLYGQLLQGPTETPFEGGTFELSINVPEQYPLVPPNVRFRTKIFHPNVHFRVSKRCSELVISSPCCRM